jgi:hypothetical protein
MASAAHWFDAFTYLRHSGTRVFAWTRNPATRYASGFPGSRFACPGMTAGSISGDMIDFEGAALQLPGVNFEAVLTRISD